MCILYRGFFSKESQKSYAFECSVSKCSGKQSAFVYWEGDIQISNMNTSYNIITTCAGCSFQSLSNSILNFTTVSNCSSSEFCIVMVGSLTNNVTNCNYLNNEFSGDESVDSSSSVISCPFSCPFSNCSFMGNKGNYLFPDRPTILNCFFHENTLIRTVQFDPYNSFCAESIETLFKGGNYTFENDLAQKIKDGIVNTFTEICDLLYQNYSSNYISKLTHFDNARNISDGTQFFSKCDFLFLAIRNIGTSPAVAISNAYLLLCGKDPVPVPPVNPSVIGIHSDNDLQKLICNFKDFKIVRELKIGFGISYVCEKKGKQYLLSTVPYNIQFKKRFDLLHPALSNVCGIILSDKDHPFFIVEDYGSEIPSNLIGESLLATAAALSYCHSVGIHHGQLRPDCITKVKDFVHLSLVGVSESFGHKVTDYDDVYSFGQLGLQLYKDCSPEVKSLFEECIKNKSMTMKTVFDRLSVSQISDDYCHMLSQFESRRQRAISGDRFAIEDIKTHMKLTSNGDVPLLPEIKESGIDVCPPLYIAAMNNNVRDIKRLIKSGANPNATAVDGSTALHAAVLRGNIESIRVLRNYCDRSSKDILGRSPHDVAGPNEKRALLKQIDGMTGLLLRSLVCLLSKPF